MHIARRWLCLSVAITGAIPPGLGQEPPAFTVSAGGGSPFTAPAATVFSIYDYRALDNVSDSLHEFIELNADLPGSVVPAPLSAAVARDHLRALLAGDKNRALLKAAADAPNLQTVDALNAAAMMFFVRSRPAEGLACLFLAAEKAPRDPATLLNLASAALVFRQANEALALVVEAQKTGALPPAAWGMSGDRLADYLRGYALMLRGEYAAARPLLQRVVQAEPNLKEAALALALVEARLGENPRKSFLQGVWRQRGKLVVRDPPEPATEAEAGREPDAFTEGEDIAPSMADLFDLTQGTPGRLPPAKRPQTPAELTAITGPYTETVVECMDAASRLQNEVVGPAVAAFTDSRASPAYKRRQLALYNRAVLRIGAVPELDRAARESDFLCAKLNRLTEEVIDEAMAAQAPIRQRHAELNNRPDHPTPAELRQQIAELNASTQRAIDITARLLASYHQALDREFLLRSSYMHGMLAHLGAPGLRTALLAEAETARFNIQQLQLSAVVNLVHAIGAPVDANPPPAEPGEAGHGPGCTDEDAKWSVSVDLVVVGAEVSCNSVSLEAEMPVVPPFIGLSAEVGIDTSGTVTVFAGPKASSSHVGSVKEGLYITAGKDGVRDFGGKAEVKASGSYGPVTVSRKVAEGTISFVPGPDAGPPPGPLPVFSGASR